MDLEDRFAVVHVGEIEDDAAVEAAGPEERRVQDVRAVRGGEDDDAGIAVEAVHLHEDLVQRLFALVAAAAHAGAALAADGVDLVDKKDRWRGALGLHEGVARAGCADADEHLNELGRRDIEEGNIALARDRARDERFARARRSHEEYAARDACTEIKNFCGFFKKSTTSINSSFASFNPATSLNITLSLTLESLRFDRPKLNA